MSFRKRAKAIIAKAPALDIPAALSIEDIALACEATRKLNGIGLRAAARQMEISPTTLLRFERGEDVDLRTVKEVAKWLGVRTVTIKI